MRRTILLVVAILVLGMALSVPAAADPYGNPSTNTWEITCPNQDPFTVMSPWMIPGWPLDGGTPVLLLGGEFTYTDQYGSFTWADPPPPGLMPRLTRCTLKGPLEDIGIDVVGDPVYMLFPGQ